MSIPPFSVIQQWLNSTYRIFSVFVRL